MTTDEIDDKKDKLFWIITFSTIISLVIAYFILQYLGLFLIASSSASLIGKAIAGVIYLFGVAGLLIFIAIKTGNSISKYVDNYYENKQISNEKKY